MFEISTIPICTIFIVCVQYYSRHTLACSRHTTQNLYISIGNSPANFLIHYSCMSMCVCVYLCRSEHAPDCVAHKVHEKIRSSWYALIPDSESHANLSSYTHSKICSPNFRRINRESISVCQKVLPVPRKSRRELVDPDRVKHIRNVDGLDGETRDEQKTARKLQFPSHSCWVCDVYVCVCKWHSVIRKINVISCST